MTDRIERFAGVKRLSYFEGQLLSAEDLRDEQTYFIAKRHLLNRALHGSGVVTGLSVTVGGDSSNGTVVVEPGLAFDNKGREIDVCAPVTLDIPRTRSSHYVIVEYTERETDAVAFPTATAETMASRSEEGAVIRYSEDDAGDGVAVGRIVPSGSGWRVDHAFKPGRCR
jgi:hypothetical protein